MSKTEVRQSTNDFADYVVQKFSKQNIIETRVFRDEITWTVLRSELIDFLFFLREDNHCRFTRLVDVTAVDNGGDVNRFTLVYHVQSLLFNRIVCVKTTADADIPVASATEVFPVANWYEREIWDMFGIPFSGHSDLRCILTDDAFKGEPLRKDFPLSGEKKLRYDAVRGQFYYDAVVEKPMDNKAKVTELG